MWGIKEQTQYEGCRGSGITRRSTPNITGSNEKGGKRLRLRGSLQVSEGGGKGGREMEQQKF